MSRIRVLAGLCLLTGLAFSACDAKVNVNVAQPSPGPSSSAQPSSSPSSLTPASPDPSATPNPGSSSTPTPTVSASAGGKLVVSGADVFNGFSMDYKKGQKWVYKMTLKGLTIAAPSLPPGVSLPPGFSLPGSSGSSDMDLGEMSMEVIDVSGDTVTMKTDVKTTVGPSSGSASASSSIKPSTVSFKKNSMASLYSEVISAGAEGTLNWTSGGTESVSVPAGSYSAGRVNGVMKVKSVQNGVTGDLDQTIAVWISNNVGMVKEEVKSNVSASGSGASGSTNVTTVIELKSFSN